MLCLTYFFQEAKKLRSTLGNVSITVWIMYLLMLGCKRFKSILVLTFGTAVVFCIFMNFIIGVGDVI